MQDTNKSNKMFVQVDCFKSIMYSSGLSDCDHELLLVKILTYWLIDHDELLKNENEHAFTIS